MAVDSTKRALSSAVFGNRALLDVVEAIERLTSRQPGVVTTRGVASEIQLSDSVVRPVMRRLHAAGLIRALPREGGPRSVCFFEVLRGTHWTALIELCRALTDQ